MPAAPTPEPLITVKNLVKEFQTYDRRPGIGGAFKDLFNRDYKNVRAVNDVSFTIQRGEMIGYIGANGAGKSTTLKILCGILFPTSGEVSVDGRTPWKDRQKHVERIGAVFGQRSQLMWDLAAGESLRLIARIYGVTEKEYDERMDEFQTVLGLNEFIKTPVRKLSLGQKMRCELAAALIHRPPILFLDEPTIGLDVVAKQAIREFLKRVNKERNVTMILTTHDLREIEQLCHRVMILDHGRVIFDGEIEMLKKEAGDAQTLIFRLDHTLAKDWWPNELPRDGIVWKHEGADLKALLTTGAAPRAEVIRAVLDSFGTSVLDITIEEQGIEEIVRHIYNNPSAETKLSVDAKLREALTGKK